jgi:O-methyltransferase
MPLRIRCGQCEEKDEEDMLLDMMVKDLENVEGVILECGVFNGDSAQEIVNANMGKKEIYLIDCFEGLPKPSVEDAACFKEGDYKGDYEAVKKRFENNKCVTVIKGYIPDVFRELNGKRFSFIHLDLDLYKPTYEALMVLRSAVSKGGVILIHDQSKEGVRRAIRDWHMSILDYFMVIKE